MARFILHSNFCRFGDVKLHNKEDMLTTSSRQFGSMGKPGSSPFQYDIKRGSSILVYSSRKTKTDRCIAVSSREFVMFRMAINVREHSMHLLPSIHYTWNELSTILGLTITVGRSSRILSITISPIAFVSTYVSCQP